MKRIVLAEVICFALSTALLLPGCTSDDNAGPQPPATQPKGRAEADLSNMTKWGPMLTEKELAEIAKLSVPELAEMLKSADTMHRFAALRQLKADGGWRKNFDLLLRIAGKRRGEESRDMVVEGLLFGKFCPLRTSAPAEDKQLVDKFLAFLQGQLKEVKPSVSGHQAVRSIARTVFHRDHGLPGSPAPEIPYANDRVLDILISCLDNDDRNVRQAAIRWLGAVGATDLARSEDVIAALETQLTKEQTSQENEEVKTRRERVIQYAIGRLKLTIAQWHYPHTLSPFPGGSATQAH
ncbi:MAG: HEAT repeat domain-containing protein [Phycisphaerae bacterium]|nr:HEAT repeat domain-containing protein [Phycisphaerae bacterium]